MVKRDTIVHEFVQVLSRSVVVERRKLRHYWDRVWVFLLPKRLLTSFVGWFARRPVSRHFIPWFIRMYQIDVHEAELPLHEYQTWVQFFSRKLRFGVREVTGAGIASPVDGVASTSGEVVNGSLIQAKGHEYSAAALLGDDVKAARFVPGQYITLYLSPHDYHRVHMPVDGTIVGWTYVPGNLYPVNRAGVRSVEGLFTKNERLIVDVASAFGDFAIVLVGATIVGSISTAFGPTYESPFRRRRLGIRSGQTQLPLERGEELGMFEFGSTVILLFPPDMSLQLNVKDGDVVRMGQLLGSLTTVPE